MNIGNAIRQIRKNQDMSQAALSGATGITQAALSQIENGKRPGTGTMKKICKALQMPEALVYVMAIEKEDVPPEKALLYDTLFPVIQGLVLQVVGKE
jgi:transcriptional regulator with XRE-family HTH domain